MITRLKNSIFAEKTDGSVNGSFFRDLSSVVRIGLLQMILMISFIAPVFSITLNDNGKISATEVSYVIQVKSELDIVKAIQEAQTKHLSIAIMGKQHSQGGQSLAPNAIALNMLSFNKVLGIDIKKKQITVESGITWSDLQKFINPYNLAIKSMQSPNIFTVGGSISVNAHGDDFRAGSVGNSVVGFHLILANGKKIFVTHKNNPDLWAAVIGGYGLVGVVSDVTLQLTDNTMLMSDFEETDISHFTKLFNEKIKRDPEKVLFYAHLNITPGEDFLRNMYVISYKNMGKLPENIIPLDNPERWNFILKPLFNSSRYGKKSKTLRWKLQKKIFSRFYKNKIITRNNAMEKPVRFASDHSSKYDADWLQEYFIPVDKLPEFITFMQKIIMNSDVNLLNVTIRYVPAEQHTILNYAARDRFAVVLYFNQQLLPESLRQTKKWTYGLINAALSVNGTYYLPYQPLAEKTQFHQAYPNYKKLINIKNIYDPGHIFTSNFYHNYLE